MPSKSKNIFFLPGNYDGCYWYRGYLPGLHSACSIANDFIGKTFNSEEMLKKAMEADIVVIQRPNEPIRAQIAKLLKAKGKKIVFDNDDTYLPDVGVPLKMLGSDKQRQIAKEMNQYLYDTIAISDAVTASTEFLADEYRKIHKNVHVLKNCIDPQDEFPVRKNETGKFRVLIAGSVASNDDYLHIKDQLRQLDEREDVTIIVFGIIQPNGNIQGAYNEDYAFWDSLNNVEWQRYVPVNEYMYTISKLAPDLAIIPRQDSYFNRCKSNIKFLEMSLLGIPVLAQGFTDGKSPYQGVDEPYMTVLVDNSAWHDTIIEIKCNYDKYKSLALKAQEYVKENYNIRDYAKICKQTLLKITK